MTETPSPIGPLVRSRISTVRIEGDGLPTRLALAVEGTGRLRVYFGEGSNRLVIEGDGLRFGDDLATAAIPAGTGILEFRYGLLQGNGGAQGNEGRLVFDLERPARLQSLDQTSQGIDITLVFDGLRLQADEPRVIDLAAPPTLAVSAGLTGSAVKAARPVVMIDPGHGGRDPGAVTDGGIYEKDVVLAVARRLAAALSGMGRYDVRLTRDGDQSVPLDRRVALSRAARSDLFISLHADTFAGQPQAATVRGGAVYVLSERASDRTAEALALRENAADSRLGADAKASATDATVDALLADLASRETRVFAHTAQAGLVRTLSLAMQLARDPARGAAFRVLKQAETPAVLIELGYMSHAEDIARLQAADWQERVARAIARAVDGYFSTPRSAIKR